MIGVATAPLGYVAAVRPSGVDKLSTEGEQAVELCNYTDVYYGDRITRRPFMAATATPDEVRRFTLRRDDVAVTKDSETPDDIGVSAWIAEDLPGVLLGYHLSLIGPGSSLEGRYLHWALQSRPLRDYFARRARGVTRYALRQEDVTSAPIPLPDLEQQRLIAGYLDAETARIDDLISRNDRLAQLGGEQHERTVVQFATRGTRPSGVRSGLGWCDAVAADFAVGPYSMYGRTGSGHTPSRSVDDYWIDCDIPWVTTSDVRQLRSGRAEFIEETAEHISRHGMENSAARLHPAGTVFLSRTASVGFAGIMSKPMATSQDFFVWIPDERLTAEYLLWSLRAMRYGGLFDQLMYGSTHKTIYVPDLLGLRGPIPPLAEQRRIVEAIRRNRDHAFALIDRARQVNELLRERREALITAAVTGQIEV